MRRTSAIYHRKFHTDDVCVNFVILHELSFASFVNRKQIFFDPSLYTPCTRSLCPAANVLHFHVFTSCTSNFNIQNILEILATDEIHMEDRNQTCLSTATFQLCGTRMTNRRINLSSLRNNVTRCVRQAGRNEQDSRMFLCNLLKAQIHQQTNTTK